MKIRYLCSSVLCVAAALSQFPVWAEDTVTVTYTYDALGRVVITTTAGGPSNGAAVATCFDRVGNRIRYDVATGAPSPTPTPCPTPTPSP